MIGQGVYTLNEAALYAGVPVATARAWFVGRSDDQGLGPLFCSDFARVDDDYALSFYNLIEAYVARFFRSEGVKPRMLRHAHQKLQQELGTPHPFAHADLATDGKRIIIQDGHRNLIDVISKQYFFPQMNLGRIKYGVKSRLAESWAIAEGVQINPEVNYGKPVIENTGVSTAIVAHQYRANAKDAALVARLFKLTEAGVINAYNFELSRGRIAA